MAYYFPSQKMLKLSKKNHKYYEIIAKTLVHPPQEENIFSELKQNLGIVIFMFCFLLWNLLAVLL